MKQLLTRLAPSFFVLALIAVGGTAAYFSDAERSTGNTFAAGEIDLLIDNESYYNGELNPGTSWLLANLDTCIANDGENPCLFFNFLDLKPDDEGEDTISVHVDTNDAWACMDIAVTDFDDNGLTEPEEDDGDSTGGEDEGELQNEIEFVWWADDGDNVLESDEETFFGPATLASLELHIPLADSSGNGILSEGPLAGGETYYIGKAWCFGDLSLNPVPAGEGENPTIASGVICDGTTLDNVTQTDSVTGEITFTAVQSRSNPGFLCSEPVVRECIPEEAFADNVVDFDQGVRNNGTPVLPDRTDPTDALGAPQSTGTPFDNPAPAGEFFSLGFDEGTDETPAEGGWIIVEFTDNIIVDGPGNDLRVWEVTGGTSYPVEKVKIEVSQDGSTWHEVSSSLNRDAEADLADSGLAWAAYVRLTDVSVRAEFEATADGYDLDAFSALNCAAPVEIDQ